MDIKMESMEMETLYQLFLEHPSVTTDSRNCPEGSIFFALRGESFNGNAYAAQALEKGCVAAVVDEAQYATDERCILVDNVLATLQQLAALHRQRWGGTILQVTGSNGKTTTKELTAAVLSRKYKVQYTKGNLNNHIGVPLTLLSITAKHDMAVVETGANHPGEIAQLCTMVQADCGLVTNVGHCHLEGFGSFEGVKRAKGELYDDLSRRGKTLFLNTEDDNLSEMATHYHFLSAEAGQCIPYVEARVMDCDPFLAIQWRTAPDQDWHMVKSHLVGTYNIANLQAAITVGLFFGVDAKDIDMAISTYKPTNSRSELRTTARNYMIVDAYNANPTSMEAALTSFSSVKAARKMVILGDMKELGPEGGKEHQHIVDLLRTIELEQVWLVGEDFAATDHAPFQSFANVEAVVAALKAHPLEGYTILVKGSHVTKLYQLPDYL